MRHLILLLILFAAPAGTLRAAGVPSPTAGAGVRAEASAGAGVGACAAAPAAAEAAENNTAPQATAAEAVRFTGRALEGADGSLAFDWSGSHFTFRFEGTRCTMHASDTRRNYYNVFVDGILRGKATTEGPCREILLAEGLSAGEHTVLVQKRTEAEQGRTTLYGVSTDGRLLPPPAARERLIEFIGDSHTCGYGTEGRSVTEPFTPETENCDLAWGCLLARWFDADYTLIAHSGQGVVRNWGIREERSEVTMRERFTRTFDMEATPAWDFSRYRPDIVVIKLGTNDFSTGTPSEEEFRASFGTLYERLRSAYGAEVPILYVVPQDCRAYYDYLCRIMAERGDAKLQVMQHETALFNGTDDLGAGYHPALGGQRKMAVAAMPYIATLTGWEMPFGEMLR